MIPKSVKRFSEKIMLKQKDKAQSIWRAARKSGSPASGLA
jgi:hypothetical protein